MADIFADSSFKKKFVSTVKRRGAEIKLDFKFGGFNEDITEMYYWHLNFPYFTGVGYIPIKIEDNHYFSENSQFGQGMRQVKGGSIQAFQQNIQQLVQLIKVHLFPLLKEIKQADFYKSWFDRITVNDDLIDEELKKSTPNEENLKKWRKERNEALNHLKDKWVGEVDGGKLWQISGSQREGGLDFALLPQLFFGTNLDDPLEKRKSLKEQLDEDIYEIDISLGAKENVARFMYRFYTWLPSAIKDTEITFKLKLANLRQIYSQVEMQIEFMKPILKEIYRKTEKFDKNNFYRDFDTEHPDFVNLLEQSYSHVNILAIKKFGNGRGPWEISDLEIGNFGLYLRLGKEIQSGPYKGKKGFILSEKNGKYLFKESDKKDISREEFKKLKIVEVDKDDLLKLPTMVMVFSSRRRNELLEVPQQGAQQVPYMMNKIDYEGYAWDIVEIASYRASLKEDSLDLIENFVSEIKVIREDLEKYLFDFDEDKSTLEDELLGKNLPKPSSPSSSGGDFDFLKEPFEALYSVFLTPFMDKKGHHHHHHHGSDEVSHDSVKYTITEGVWKMYTINKKAHRYLQY